MKNTNINSKDFWTENTVFEVIEFLKENNLSVHITGDGKFVAVSNEE